MPDPLGIFIAAFLIGEGLIFWLVDHLTAVREANRVEAIKIRVIGADWKHGRFRQMPWLDRKGLRTHIDRAMRGGY